MTAAPRHVAILVFDDVEVLDFAGPFEVFGVAGRGASPPPFQVSVVSTDGGAITARNGLRVEPHHGFADCPPVDVLVVPGGWGSRALLEQAPVLDWVTGVASSAERVLSVCTGALVLARVGLLAGGPATTHHGAYDELRAVDPTVEVVEGVKMVDRGRVVTSGGISAGIDMSLGVVGQLLGTAVAQETADYMEYDWTPAKVGVAGG